MALPFVWTTVSMGDKIVYDDTLTDLRKNADYLHDNLANVANDISIDGTQDSAIDVNDDTTVYSTADSGWDNDLDGTVRNQYDSSDEGSDFGSKQ
jgi:hypothetical protein